MISFEYMKTLTINIKVNPNSSKKEIIKIDESNFRIKVMNPPVNGRANKELIELLADYFKITKNQIEIKRGLTGNYKIVKIQL